MTGDRIIPGTEAPARESIAVDFDGVLHSYTSPWTGDPAHIPDPPVPGAIGWLTEMVATHDVYVFTCRLLVSKRSQVERAMRRWLREHCCDDRVIDALHFTHEKPHASVYIDDRGWRFSGTFPSASEIAAASIPWNRKSR